MPIATVKQLCKPSPIVTSDSLVEQVAQLENFGELAKSGSDFFKRNYFTDGLKRLVERGFERLAGRSDEGSFYLTQAMGGGKTHSLLAFGLLAADPTLRKQVFPNSAAGGAFGAAKVVIFSGHQNPESLLWGHVAEKLGRPDVMAPFWRNGARTPGVDEWAAVLGDQPVLILLDELPSYLQMAQGEPVGNTTLGDLTIGALERLFNALERCPRACVVVTNLKDDVYLDGSGQLRTLIESLSKHYDRNAAAITPVQQNTSEVFAIVRKRLFDTLPTDDRIDEVAQAYVGALQKAKRVDTIASTPEAVVGLIRETYPFHPSIRDIVARFSENRGYQKTRALIRLLRLAVRGALAGDGNVFLVGLQHLDFNDQATLEELRKINDKYVNAIARDVASRGDALAERIDKLDGNTTASWVAKVLLMSSLSSAASPLRGLTDGELIEALVDPLLEVSEIKSALGRLQGQAWYLFQGVDQRIDAPPGECGGARACRSIKSGSGLTAWQSSAIRRAAKRSATFWPRGSTGAKRYLRIAGYFRSSLLEVVGEALETVGEIRVVCNGDLDPYDVKVAKAAREGQAAVARTLVSSWQATEEGSMSCWRASATAPARSARVRPNEGPGRSRATATTSSCTARPA